MIIKGIFSKSAPITLHNLPMFHQVKCKKALYYDLTLIESQEKVNLNLSDTENFPVSLNNPDLS